MTFDISEIIDSERSFSLCNGIHVFNGDYEDPWGESGPAWLRDLGLNSLGELLERNYRDHSTAGSDDPLAQQAAQTPGLILEAACGPGLGNALSILDHNPAAKIIANDLGFRILDCWKDLLESKRPDSDVCFARFDMKSIPFADNSIDAVSSYGGFSNIPDRRTAIAESCRVLKPGGTIYLNDGELDPESFRRLPPEAQDEWRKIEPGMGTGLIEMLEESGVQISMKAEPARVVLKPGESTLADIGQRHGVELSIINYRMTAVKPW